MHYLGPQGSFTHQAAAGAAELLSGGPLGTGCTPQLIAVSDVPAIVAAVERGEAWGVVAWENNVEGYVVPNLDLLIDSRDAVGFVRVAVDIAFDAFARGPRIDLDGVRVSAHPHGPRRVARRLGRGHPVLAAGFRAACRPGIRARRCHALGRPGAMPAPLGRPLGRLCPPLADGLPAHRAE